MTINLFNCKQYKIKTYVKIMNYLFELVKEHHVTGTFVNINILDYKLAKKHNLVRESKNKKSKMPPYFFRCVEILTKLGVLEIYGKEERETENKQRFYYFKFYKINKHDFLVFYCLILSLNDYKNRQSAYFTDDNFEETFLLLFKIVKDHKDYSLLKSQLLDSIIKSTYSYLASIFATVFEIDNPAIHNKLNNYVKPYLRAIKDNKISPRSEPFIAITYLTTSWFSDCYCNEEQLMIQSEDNINNLNYYYYQQIEY